MRLKAGHQRLLKPDHWFLNSFSLQKLHDLQLAENSRCYGTVIFPKRALITPPGKDWLKCPFGIADIQLSST
ncbi:hypothetical protein TBK1r_33490 [Stieleria magnilauensis]|uniref:Uncharacterized protein n=1 Tax=Stieleria magnilauensis TaxID=2527963 RepID=A0ABX5XQX2_9BACT|nr:hypothetical protein TBK1r_33490 [Planctomycetes bacterium TBK1r]